MAKTGPLEFIQQVRAEAQKVTWPTRKETIITSIMVILMAVLTALIFLAADQFFTWAIAQILGIGR